MNDSQKWTQELRFLFERMYEKHIDAVDKALEDMLAYHGYSFLSLQEMRTFAEKRLTKVSIQDSNEDAFYVDYGTDKERFLFSFPSGPSIERNGKIR